MTTKNSVVTYEAEIKKVTSSTRASGDKVVSTTFETWSNDPLALGALPPMTTVRVTVEVVQGGSE